MNIKPIDQFTLEECKAFIAQMKGDDPAMQIQVYQRYYALIEEANRPQDVEVPIPTPVPHPEPQLPKLSNTPLFDLDIPTLACLVGVIVIVARQIVMSMGNLYTWTDLWMYRHHPFVQLDLSFRVFISLLGIIPLVALLKRKSYAISTLLVFLVTNMFLSFIGVFSGLFEKIITSVFLGLIIFGIVKSKSLKKFFPLSERTFSKYSLIIPALYLLYWGYVGLLSLIDF